jgi:hypothetical protein
MAFGVRWLILAGVVLGVLFGSKTLRDWLAARRARRVHSKI